MRYSSFAVGRAVRAQRRVGAATARAPARATRRRATRARSGARARRRCASCRASAWRAAGSGSGAARSRFARVEVVDDEREASRVAADLVQAEQAVVAVEGGVLDALRHHGRRRLLEADDERVVAALLEQQDRREPRRQPGLGDRLAVEAVDRAGVGVDVGAVDGERRRARAARSSSLVDVARGSRAASRPRARTSSAPARASPRARSPRTGARSPVNSPVELGERLLGRRDRRTARSTSFANS